MKRIDQSISTMLLLSVLIFIFPVMARATPVSSLDRASSANDYNLLIQSYRLTLSLSDYNSNSSDVPYITLSFSNPTLQHTLLFRWTTTQDAAFEVEYKATGDPLLDAGWKPLKMKAQVVPIAPKVSAPDSDVVVQSATYSLRIVIKPGQTDSSLSLPLNYLMSKKGFYRIKAVVRVPGAYEFSDAVSPPSLIRIYELAVRSDPILIRHIATGFVEIKAVSSKTVAPK